MPLDLDLLRKLVELMREHQVAEVEHREGEGRLRVTMASGLALQDAHAPGQRTEAIATRSPNDFIVVTSPLVGTFYRSAGPDTAPFVEVGSSVRRGQTVCIVEAMKLMNEVEADAEGVIAEVLVENGTRVEYGQPLFHLRLS
jgi:acetyl-CoA carboxylase biotin carboxyl carrier protein